MSASGGSNRFRFFLGGQIGIFVVLLVVRSCNGGGDAEKSYIDSRQQVQASFASVESIPPDEASVERAEETAAELSRAVALLEARIDYRVAPERGEEAIVDRNDFAQALIDARTRH